MATPTWQFHDNFESGDATGWDLTGVDVGSQRDYPHYTQLARERASGEKLPMPYAGAYCARWTMGAVTNDSTLGDTAVNITDGQTVWVRFNIWFSSDIPTLSSTTDDTVPILEFQEAVGTVVYALGFFYDDSEGTIHWALGQTTPSAAVTTSSITLGKWHTVELKVNIQTGEATGEMELYVTEEGQEPSETALATDGTNTDSGPVAHAYLGTQDKEATTLGTILIDDFICTANAGTRIYPDKDRFSTTKTITSSQHVFVGAGTVDAAVLAASAAANDIIAIYDTDTSQTYQDSKKLVLANISAYEVVAARNSVPFHVVRGCYVDFESVTETPQVMVNIKRAPNWFSEGNIRRYALQRRL